MIIVVNDANILIDVIKLGLVNEFFALPFEFHTTQLIIDEELYDEQLEQLQPHIDAGELEVRSFTAQEMTTIATINHEKPQLSDKDCSAFFCADDLDAVLLTSDNNLRRFAKQKNVEVHGHLWLFDELVDCGCIQTRQAVSKLDELDIINPRLKLPKDECDKRNGNGKQGEISSMSSLIFFQNNLYSFNKFSAYYRMPQSSRNFSEAIILLIN